ncbi:hypothetical protein [Kutzneria albida]|uniref:Uncharacterized protein n=1 Tax=Kutzneria albida DSM 43870 TaxID=1449976 RepID=W5WJK0_9PSEU|nr:hypothetical protein [Kutzneria albida]AHH98344.1 hypothetical protein KALB_4982 [Kutzneria albida DSM 43870]
MQTVAKGLVAVVMALLVAVQPFVTTGFTMQAGCSIAVAVLTAIGVYLVPSVDGVAPWAKTAVAFLLAGAQAAVQVASTGGINTQGWITILLAALGVVAVHVVPNKPASVAS